MTQEQQAREAALAIGRVDVTDVIIKVIEALPAARRLYPDIFAHEVTAALLAEGLIQEED